MSQSAPDSSGHLQQSVVGWCLRQTDTPIVYCTPFGAQHADIEFMIGAGNALDPTKYFIIVPEYVRQWAVVVAVEYAVPVRP